MRGVLVRQREAERAACNGDQRLTDSIVTARTTNVKHIFSEHHFGASAIEDAVTQAAGRQLVDPDRLDRDIAVKVGPQRRDFAATVALDPRIEIAVAVETADRALAEF